MDQKLFRYFSSLREEAEAAQRGASSSSSSSDISEIIRDIADLCEDLITDEDISLALAMVFDPATGIFDVIQRLMLNRERSVQKGRESCLVFVADFVRKSNVRVALYVPFIKDQCINVFQRDESKSVQAASLLPLISLLQLLMQNHDFFTFSLDWTVVRVFLKEEENVITILNICLDTLDEQLKQKGKGPSFVLVAGAIKCLDGILMWFDRTVPAGGSVEASRRIYSYIEQALYFREDLKRYEMVKAGLRLLSRHACLFRLRLLDDCMIFLKWLQAYCTHVNAQLRSEALSAFNEFIYQIAICLSSGDPRIKNPQDVYKKLFVHALGVLDAEGESAKMISLAVHMIGKLSPAIMRFSGKDVLQQAFQRVVAFASFSQRINDVQDESIGFLVTLVSAITDIIGNLEDIDNYIVTIVAEAVGNIFFKFPYLFPKQKLAVYVTIQDLFRALVKKGATFIMFLKNIVWSSLQRAIEPMSSNQGNLGMDLWKSYTELWSKLIDIENARSQQREETSEEALTLIEMQEKIFDAMVVCVMKVLQELNLKYRVKRMSRTDTENVKEDDDEVISELDSDKNIVEPINDKDMKKFLNLVEFVQDLLSSDSMPFFPKWVLPFGRLLVELSSNYPLLSGFYKLLAVLIKAADKYGYFKNVTQPVSMDNIICLKKQEQSFSVLNSKRELEEDHLICQDLFRRYLQEVLISSKRYKLELLASCLCLCLSSPPCLIKLSVLVEPIKVALKMGLRYNPLASVAMDALERWIIFSKSELDVWLYQIVPCFNNYLSITLVASAMEVGSQSSFEDNLPDSSNRNLSHHRIKRERKALFQSDALQGTQIRIQRFLGRIGMHAHYLVPDVNLLQVAGTGGLAWDTTEQIKFILPFRDDKADIWLDSLLPRIVDLALSASNRSTKVCASELLHALCLLMMGNCAKGPRTRTGESVHYDKIYRKVFPAIIRLAADVEQVTRELFGRLLMQMIHWFTSNTQKENPDTMALLDAILEGLVDYESASLREFSAECFEEFMQWSIRHVPPEADNFINVTSMLRRLYNRLDHPNPYHRLGSAMACSRLYRVMRVHTPIIDRHLLEILFFCIKSLRIAEEDHEQIGTVKQICKVLDEFQRLLQRNISNLVLKRKDRAMFTTIDDFLEWLFKQTVEAQAKCRSRCMYLFDSICQVLQVGSPSSWLTAVGKSQMLNDAYLLLNTKLTFVMLDQEEILSGKLEQQIKCLCRSLHWYEWGLKLGFVKLEELHSKATNLAISIREFLKSLLNEKIVNLVSLLTPSEFEHQEIVRCRGLMHLMSFTKEVLCNGFVIKSDDVHVHDKDHITNYTYVCKIVPFDDPEFVQVLCLLLLSPQEIAIKHIADKGDALLRGAIRIMKLLMVCSSNFKEKILECLKLLLERPELDLANLNLAHGNTEFSGSKGLISIECLLRGYRHLLLAGLLLPALGIEKSRALAEKLLMYIFAASKNSKTVTTKFSEDVFSLCMSLGMKVERVLEVVFDETPVASSSDGHLTAGSAFYITFRAVLIHHIKFSYNEILPILLRRTPENPTARLILSALLDDYMHTRTEGNIITICSFLNVFMKHISFLTPLSKLDGAYNDKLFFLEVLNKLLVLDADRQIVLSCTHPSFEFIVDSFLSLLGGSSSTVNSVLDPASKSLNLIVQNSALALVPCFANATSAHMFSNRLLNVLISIVTTYLLVREADLPPGSTQRATYLQTLNGILEAVCSSKNSELLEVLFPILQNCIPLARKLVIRALKQYAMAITDQRTSVCVKCLEVIHDGIKVPTLKQVLTDIVLIPILDAAPLDFNVNWFVKHIKSFMITISEKPPLGLHKFSEEEQGYLVVKNCTYSIISSLFMNVDGSTIRDTITPLVSNQQIMQVATNDSRAKNDPAQYPFSENIVMWRELHIRAYNCLAAVVMCTQEQEKIFTILFKDFTGKPLWQHLIDCNKIYNSFPVEVSQLGTLQEVTKNLRLERKASRRSESISPFVSSLHVIGATLSQEPALINSFVGGESEKMMETSEVNDANEYDNNITDMKISDQDDFDQHPCLAMVLRVIVHLHSKTKSATSDEMPEWMKALHSTLCSAGTPMNVCLFIIKVVIKARRIFSPFGYHWIHPVLLPFLKEPERSGGKSFHYMLRDICITILEWNVSSPPDISLLSRFLNYLLEVTPNGSSQVLRANLEIIQHILSRWKNDVKVDIDIIASYITAGGKTPSTSDKVILMHRIVGLQLLGAMMSIGVTIYDDIKLPKSEMTKILLSNINLKAKGVYEASAEILGMILHQDKGLYEEQQLQSGLKKILLGIFKEGEVGQYLSILDKITLHFPSVLEEYASMVFDLLPRVHGVFRILSLNIILRCPTAIPNIFTVVLPFLSKLLTHRDEAVQMKSLQLVAELVKDAETGAITELILPVLDQTFISHDNDECRKHYYKILVYLYTERKMERHKTLIQSLLQGLYDDSPAIRENLKSFWHTQLNKNPQQRLLEIVTHIYDPVIESHWVHIGISLLLKLCEESVDFNRPIFNAPLSECEFKEYTIDTTILAGTLPMTPMFFDTQSTSEAVQSDEGDENIHIKKFPGMIRATIQQSESLEPSQSQNSLTASLAESGSSLFAFSKRHDMRTVGIKSQVALGDDGISTTITRRLIHPSASRPQILRGVLNGMKRREARMAQQAVERANKVQMLRRYRVGELPDIEINHSEIINPLAALAEKDPTFSRLLLLVLFRAIYSLPSDKYFGSEQELKSLVNIGIEKMFERTENDISFVSCALSLGLEDKESWIRPELIGSVSTKSANYQSGILYLENAILRKNMPWQYVGNVRKRHKGSRGQSTLEPNSLEHAWLALSNLYRSLGESDIVLSIYKKHLTKASITQQALEAELDGELATALKMYDNAIDQFDDVEATVIPSEIEQDLWYTRRLHCLASLLNWHTVMDEILFQVENSLSKLWEPRAQDSYLSLFIRAAVKMPTHHAKLCEFLQPIQQDNSKNVLILNDFCTQVATLAVSNDQFDRARFYIRECYKSFVKHWAEFHPLATSARHILIANLQKITELNEFVDHIGSNKFCDWSRIMLEWSKRWPSPSMDDAEAWDDIVQNRLLFFQKFQSAFNRCLKKGEEYEGSELASQLDEQRAHIYFAASRGLMKQGNYQAAKSFMNQFVSFKKEKLDYKSYKNIIKLRCLEADRVSTRDPQKSISMLAQVLSYISSTSHKYNIKEWQCGLKLLEGSTNIQLAFLNMKEQCRVTVDAESLKQCIKQLESAFSAYSIGLCEIDDCKNAISVRTLAKSALKFAFFCDELLQSATVARWGPELQHVIQVGSDVLPEVSCYPRLIVRHIMKAIYLNSSVEAHHGIARVLTLVGQYKDADSEFQSIAKDVNRQVFIPWIPQILSSLDNDDGETFVGILEDIAKQQPQAVYFSYNVSRVGLGPVGQKRTMHLNSILNLPILESLVRSLEDLTFPEQRLRDGLSWVKTFLQAGDNVKAKEHFYSLIDDCLDVESMIKDERRSGEYNVKFCREYSKKVIDAVGKDGFKLLAMNEKQFTQATAGIMTNLQKSLKNLQSGCLNLSLFSKWMADFDQSKNAWSSQNDMIHMFGSYNGFKQLDPSLHVKVVSFDQTIVSLSSKQHPKVLKVRGSDELEYKFIVKGGEDLRLDQRIEQIFEVMNRILSRDAGCSKRNLYVRTYAVIPVSQKCGLLQFVENTCALDDVIKDGLACTLPELGLAGKGASAEITSNVRMKFHEWLAKRGGSQNIVNCYRNMYSTTQFNELEEKMNSFTCSIPWDSLRNGLLKLTTSAESFLALRTQFQHSLAVVSMCGYIAGVGDRHLSNILVDTKSGSLVPIDFGYSFGTGVMMLPVPELVPFRMTHQLTNVLLPQDAIGLLRTDMIHVLSALRNSRDIIIAVMDVFVKEPLVDWKAEAMKASSWRNDEEALETTAYEEKHVALKVDFAHRKLDLWNPAEITISELHSSVHAQKPYFDDLIQIVRGDPSRNIRARIGGNLCESIQDQVDCLIDQAIDVNLLGRIWLGWQPWM